MGRKLDPLTKELRERDKERERERKKRTRYGVFVWHENPRYPASEAVKVFKREADADAYASANYVLNYVVRTFTVDD